MATEKRLTEKDKIAYYAIENFIKENGYPPTVRELCVILGKSSTSSIMYRLESLEKKGYIKNNDRGRRTIRIIKRIEDANTVDADVVEVVRCKDCKHWKKTGSGCGWCEAWEGGRFHDNYCNYGERKDNGSD